MFNFDFLLNKKKQILFIFLICFLLEAISFVSFNFSYLNYTIFFVLSFLILVLSIYKLEWGMYLVLGEVFLNAMGYLFYFENSGFKISLRMSFWLVFMSVFLAKIIIKIFRDKKIIIKLFNSLIFKNNFFYLAFFILSALIFGFIRNSFSDVFLDFNSYLYFILILPFIYIFYVNKKDKNEIIWQNIIIIFTAIVLYICFKSLLFLFLFSHNIAPFISDIYSWTRKYYLGEITNMGNGVYRIFLQNQIFALSALFFCAISFLLNREVKVKRYSLFFSSFLLATIIISYSRSFWIALVLSFIFIIFIVLLISPVIKKSVDKVLFRVRVEFLFQLFLSFILALFFIFMIIKFPLGETDVRFSMGDISNRANITNKESAISSRWALLDVMLVDIRKNVLLGRGFGARLEYISSDPRVLETNPDGFYSSYAFEWAWLELIVKMGILGFLAYLSLIILFLFKSLKLFIRSGDYIYIALFSVIFSISIVNFFTPYLNHPLGISYLIIFFLFFDFYQKNNCKIC